MSLETKALLELGPFTVTAYSLCMMMAALFGILATGLFGRKQLGDRAWTLGCVAVPAAIFGGHFAWCCAFFPALDVDYGGYSFFLKFHQGGYTLFGAVFFVMLAAWLLAKGWKIKPSLVLDALVPGSALAICIGRMAEYFNGQGVGQFVEEDGLRFFPFAVCTYTDGDWSEWYVAVFAFEAFAALCLFVVWAVMQRKKHRPGYPGSIFLLLLSCTQIFFEQLRADDMIRFGFVRFSQLCSLLILIILLILRLRKLQDRLQITVCAVRFTAAVLCVVFIEFAFEKPQFYPWLTASIGLLALSVLFLPIMNAVHGKKKEGMHAVLMRLPFLALCIGMICILGRELENEWDFLYAFMALSITVMGLEAAPRETKEAEACIA